MWPSSGARSTTNEWKEEIFVDGWNLSIDLFVNKSYDWYIYGSLLSPMTILSIDWLVTWHVWLIYISASVRFSRRADSLMCSEEEEFFDSSTIALCFWIYEIFLYPSDWGSFKNKKGGKKRGDQWTWTRDTKKTRALFFQLLFRIRMTTVPSMLGSGRSKSSIFSLMNWVSPPSQFSFVARCLTK